jgi:UDP-glucose:glycoprotein glucosyltransferase
VYDEQPSAYFPFLSLVTTHLPSLVGLSDQAILSRALDLLESHRILSTPSALSTLQYALGLHTSSPRIEALYSWYNSTIDASALAVEGCESWVEWKGQGFCQAEALRMGVERGIEDGHAHAYVLCRTLYDIC